MRTLAFLLSLVVLAAGVALALPAPEDKGTLTFFEDEDKGTLTFFEDEDKGTLSFF